MDYRDIIKAPIITEKSTSIASDERTYVFKVDAKANKTQIKEAIQKIFNVKVESVNTVNVHPKKKRVLLVLVWQKVPLKIQLKKIHISKIKE